MGIIKWWKEKDEFDKDSYKAGVVIIFFLIIAVLVSMAVDGITNAVSHGSENGLKDVVEGVWHGSGK